MTDPTDVPVEAKPWWRSLTVLFNLAAALVAFLTVVQDQIPLPPRIAVWVGTIIATVNVGLRIFVTRQPVTMSADSKTAYVPAPPPPQLGGRP